MNANQLNKILELLKFAEQNESGVMINREDVPALVTLIEWKLAIINK